MKFQRKLIKESGKTWSSPINVILIQRKPTQTDLQKVRVWSNLIKSCNLSVIRIKNNKNLIQIR